MGDRSSKNNVGYYSESLIPVPSTNKNPIPSMWAVRRRGGEWCRQSDPDPDPGLEDPSEPDPDSDPDLLEWPEPDPEPDLEIEIFS